jgi:hypothetical protein
MTSHSDTLHATDDKGGICPKTLALFADNHAQRLMGRVSWTVEPVDGSPNQCRLVASSTILPKRLWMCLGGKKLLFVCCFRNATEKIVKRDLEEFAEAARQLESSSKQPKR